ncbi:MAG: DUF427 domain-containing protein [Dehalococcoidales bacterium]|nr:DUF427 domain-containing protein [Dehalococcoidales bacterium]
MAGSQTQIAFEPSPKWVRVLFGGKFIADSKRACLLLPGGPPYYYFPREDVRMNLLEPTEHREQTRLLGEASFWTVRAGEHVALNAAWTYPQPVSESLDLSTYVTFDWDKMDAWFEEGEEVRVHPHDPHKRIDILESTRHVQVVVLGETIADSHHPMLLFETGLPTRYYFPRLDVRMDLLENSDKVTGCAYKGKAQYYSVRVDNRVARDIAWYYPYPMLEATKIAGRIAFFNEHVDALYVDDEQQEKPNTQWS